ncbi:MAG: response regulator transcription factor [Acinetobacter sp.]|nr:response regulator transcription factor [Acinetobacter sp.]
MRILLVEDDVMIGQVVSDSLKDAHYAVDWVKDGEMACHAVDAQPYDLVLLDLGLPKKDGLQVLQFIRAKQQTPVLIATARDDIESRVQGLDFGADDYIIKPFELAELLARIRAILRRHNQSTPQLGNSKISLDASTYQVTMKETGQVIDLSNREFSVLQALLMRPNAILSRSDLEDKIYAWGEEVESNAIDYLIYVLRKKLGSDVIKNIRGVGWTIPS